MFIVIVAAVLWMASQVDAGHDVEDIGIITAGRRVVSLHYESAAKVLTVSLNGAQCSCYSSWTCTDGFDEILGKDKHDGSSDIPVLHVLWTQFKDGQFELSVVKRKSAKTRWTLVQYVGRPEVDSSRKVERWCETVMKDAYAGER